MSTHPARRKRQPARQRPFITDQTRHADVGAIDLNVTMARAHGWSEQAILAAYEVIAKLSRHNSRISHRSGSVKDCPCYLCDPKMTNKDCRNVEKHIPKWRLSAPWEA